MKKFIIALIAVCGFANDCFAGEQQRGVRFKAVTPCDILLGTGTFIKDTGENVVKGVHTTAKGLGELITAPFRAKILIPQRSFHYTPPRIKYTPGRLEEVKPPMRRVLPPTRLEAPPAAPMYYLPAPVTNRYAGKVA